MTEARFPDPVTERIINSRPGARAEYDALGPRFEFITAVIRARNERGWSQSDLAKAIGTTQSAISRLESGDQDPKLSTVAQVCQALELPFGFGGERRAG
jgi:DNA-binding XRE family transcriptional regulator